MIMYRKKHSAKENNVVKHKSVVNSGGPKLPSSCSSLTWKRVAQKGLKTSEYSFYSEPWVH